ncbi:hypothetical protein [Massilia sp. BJB1822]|uniref:hypothetical protein n=1 Tax=Massilia sp. BJB1822 TaxID=2744470 RepID=UPI00159317A0|nr:hypothetical protein [Massilia sp. BJB1822]NVE01010.1 hypothetical protein [Massilia sp. BJB1822]
MMKKIAFFVFAAATALSASLAGAATPFYCEECDTRLEQCMDSPFRLYCNRAYAECRATCIP